MKKKKAEENKKSFEEMYKSYKEGKAEAPILHKSVKVKVNTDKKLVVLTAEEIDSDGEVVEMDGGSIRNEENGIPMIDSHNSFSSVVENGLGAIRNPKFTVIGGKKCLVGEADFAPTPNGKIAEILYMGVNGGKPYLTDVSMGFMVYDYDNETRRIKQWEVFELSLVTIGANRSAKFRGKTAETLDSEKVAKDLARFKQIHNPFKEFTKLFLSDDFCKTIGYEKNGDLLVDINNMYDIIYSKFNTIEEAPLIEKKEAPSEPKLEASPEQIQKAILDAITKKLGQLKKA